jgi:transposase
MMSEADNGQHPVLTPAQRKPKRHNAKLCPVAIRERIVNALAAGDSKRAIARAFRVSNNTVTAVAEQEWQRVEARKQRIAAQAERAATQAFDRINAKLDSSDDIPLNLLVPVAGMSVDKMVLLRDGPGFPVSVQHHVDITGDDLIGFTVALSHANEDERERLKSIGVHGFALARSRLQQAQSSEKLIEAEIVPNAIR